MSLSTEATYVELNGTDSAATVYTIDLRVIDVSHIKVYKKLIASGPWTLVTSGYVILLTGSQGSTKASATFTTAPGSTYKLRFVRYVPTTQPFEYPVSGAFPAKSHEDALDRMAMCVQQGINNALSIDPSTNTLGSMTFSNPVVGANTVFGVYDNASQPTLKSYTFAELRTYSSSTSDLSTTSLADGYWSIHKNTTTGLIKLFVRSGSTVSSILLASAP